VRRLAPLALLAACVLLALWPAAGQAPAAPAGPQPRLVLFVSIDQMRFDYLTRFSPLYKGGFRTLLERGAVFTQAMYRHANNETGPGHAVLLSGRSGAHSGIVANEWYDAALKRVVNVVEDPAVSPVGGAGRGASPAQFIGFTVGDMLKKRTPASRIVGVSLKDRSAILMSGPRADAAYWYETAEGRFITSTYYMKEAPPWLQAWNARRVADSRAGTSWTRLLPDESVYLKYAGPDDVKGEWDNRDTVFPHRIRSAPPAVEFYDDLRRTPFADEMTLEVALEAMAAHELGADDATDMLAIGFSASDVIGHTYGPDSQEQMDQYLRLDLTVQKLLDAVERRVGLPRTLLVLSSDHGVMPLVEVLQAKGIAARRARPEELVGPVTEALRKRFPGAQGLIAQSLPPEFYLDLEAIRRHGLRREHVEAEMEKALLATGLIERVYTHARLLGEPPEDDPYFSLVRRSFFEPRSPHVIGMLKRHVYLSFRPGGTGHGTPYEHDRHVPIAFMGPAVRPGRYAQPCGPEDVAPTLAALLGLPYPRQDSERLLTEMLGDVQ
jgi:predicted AlkP superfamily pyrophosphatase or phosphodiesterase